MHTELLTKGQAAKQAARILAALDTDTKNNALRLIAEAIMDQEAAITEANQQDIAAGRDAGLSEALLDRLLLSPKRLAGMATDVKNVIDLPDPVGEEFESRRLPNNLHRCKRRIPLGVVGVIYESRPNVTIDISTLCLKSGNAAILRGGKEARYSNQVLAKVVQQGCVAAGLPEGTVQVMEDTDRALVREMLRANDFIDMIIPRGGAALHQFAIENATVPVITGGIGVCHVYVDVAANLSQVVPIAVNARVQRPSVCNSMDTLLVHRAVAGEILPRVAQAFAEHNVEMRCDPKALEVLSGQPGVVPVGPDDYDTEFMALIAAIKVVENIDEALDHIYEHSSRHTDAIISEDYSATRRFVNEVHSSAVMVNASTRFNDGGQLGLGAEVAVSTQQLHARGPMGLTELTTYKWVILGEGHVRP